ncbi:TlpA family protein disulfide reductase [Cohnella cellulosilytica]
MSRRRSWAIALSALFIAGIILFRDAFSDRGNAEMRVSGETVAALPEKPEIGYPAPGFSLTALDGGAYSLETSKGRPIVLNFWASWCGPCRDEAPLFAKLHEQYGEWLSIVAVNLTAVDSEQEARRFAREYGFKFPVPLDSDGAVAAKYRIRPIPTTIFIDSRGIITGGVLGALDWDLLHGRVLRLLEPSAPLATPPADRNRNARQ